MASIEFQTMFNVARKATSSNPKSFYCTLWKCVAKHHYLSGIMSILLSIPFVYGFVNIGWVNMADLVLRRKSGRIEIHMIQINGKLGAEFNTMMKYYSKLVSHNYEKSNPSNE